MISFLLLLTVLIKNRLNVFYLLLPNFNLNMEGYFKKEDLRLCDVQYTIRHTKVNCFVCGEKVFLKSNPEHPMTVHSVNENTITTIWHTKSNEIQLCEFSPECILQYKYAGLITYRKKICVSLN